MGDDDDDEVAAAAALLEAAGVAVEDEKRCSSFLRAFLCVKRSPAAAFEQFAVRDAQRSAYAS